MQLALIFWLSCLLRFVQAADPYPERDELCLASCDLTLAKLTFAGGDASEAAAQPCENVLFLQSLYLCAQRYCTDSDIEPGRAFLSLLCNDEGLPSLPPASIAANVSLQDAAPINATSKGKNLNHTVIPTEDFFRLAYNSTEYRARGRYTNRDYQNAIYIYWGIVLGLASVLNLASVALREQWPPKPLAKAVRAVQSYGSIPPLLPGQSHPGASRLESLIILGFVVLSLVLCGVKIEAFAESSLYASFPLQMYGLVGRRLSSLALANIPLIWIFSMRNSPLIWMTGWSFSTFNQFHRWIARFTVLELIAHAITFTKFQFIKGDQPRYLSMFGMGWWVWGIVALVFFSFMLAFSLPMIRYRFYDVFLLAHIAMAVIGFVGVWYHLAQWHEYFNAYLWPVIAVWLFERLARILRVLVISVFAGRMGRASLSWDEAANIVRVDVTGIVAKLHHKPGHAYYL